MNDVFISYSRRDKVFVQKLFECLKDADRTVWADWDSIPASSDWFAEIKQGIEETDSVVFVLSPEWIKSNECRKEMDYAVQMGKRLFPILYIPVDPKDVPTELAKINWVYMRDSDDFDKGFQTLCSALDTDLEWIKIHTRIQIRALEWEKKNRSASFALRGEDLNEGEKFIAGGANKNPLPTALQSEYILASRKDATKRQRQTLVGVTVALVVSIALGVVAAIQWRESVKQAQIALARQLASQAQYLNFSRSSNQMVSSLLDIQSLRLFPNTDATNFLINDNHSGYTLNRMDIGYSVNSVVFSPDSKDLILGGCNQYDKNYTCLQGFIRTVDITTKNVISYIQTYNDVKSVAISLDGRYLASGGADKTVLVRDIKTGDVVARMTHDNSVTSIAFSADGIYIASGSSDGTACIWETTSGEKISCIPHKETVYSVAFSLDGTKLVSSSGEYNVRVWDVKNGNEINQMKYERNPEENLTDIVSSVAFSPDGDYVVAASDHNSARVWEVASGNEISRMTHDGKVLSVAFSPDGKYVVSGSRDHTARVWETASGSEVFRMTHDNAVTSVAFAPNGNYIASASDDHTIRIWDASTGKNAQMTDYSTAAVFSADNEHAAWSDSNTVYVEELSTGKKIPIHTENATALALSPDGKYVAAGADNTTHIWEIITGAEVGQIIHSRSVSIVIFSSDGKFIASGSNDRTIHIWQLDKKKEFPPITYADNGGTATLDAIKSIAFSPDGKYIVVGSCDLELDSPQIGCKEGSARVWEVITGREISHMKHNDDVTSVAFSPDGKYVISGSSDTYARVWDAATGNEISHMKHDQAVSSVAFSPDGKYVVSGSWDATARVWETVTGKEVARMTHDNLVNSVSFFPFLSEEDELYVVSGGDDKTARVWEALTGKEVARMMHDEFVTSNIFSADGRFVVSGGNFTARRWAWQTQDLITNACSVMPRNLSRAEWAQFIGDARPYEATCPNLPPASEPSLTPPATQ